MGKILGIKEEIPSDQAFDFTTVQIADMQKTIKQELAIDQSQIDNDLQSKVKGLDNEKQKLISEIISLKAEHQRTFFQLKKQNESIKLQSGKNEDYQKGEIALLSERLNEAKIATVKWKENFEKVINEKNENLETIAKLRRENKLLSAQIKQINFSLNSEIHQNDETATKNQTENLDNSSNQISNDDDDNDVYEVEKLLADKIKRKKQYFLVRWKGFDERHDCWVSKENLCCPKILQKYLESKR